MSLISFFECPKCQLPSQACVCATVAPLIPTLLEEPTLESRLIALEQSLPTLAKSTDEVLERLRGLVERDQKVFNLICELTDATTATLASLETRIEAMERRLSVRDDPCCS